VLPWRSPVKAEPLAVPPRRPPRRQISGVAGAPAVGRMRGRKACPARRGNGMLDDEGAARIADDTHAVWIDQIVGSQPVHGRVDALNEIVDLARHPVAFSRSNR